MISSRIPNISIGNLEQPPIFGEHWRKATPRGGQMDICPDICLSFWPFVESPRFLGAVILPRRPSGACCTRPPSCPWQRKPGPDRCCGSACHPLGDRSKDVLYPRTHLGNALAIWQCVGCVAPGRQKGAFPSLPCAECGDDNLALVAALPVLRQHSPYRHRSQRCGSIRRGRPPGARSRARWPCRRSRSE